MQPKIAASAIRSQVESSTAPNFDTWLLARATAPSTMSSMTQPQTANAPQNQ